MPKKLIEINSLNYKYPSSNALALNNINLKIRYPSSISITGDSGCGKTTFVDLLTGLLSCSNGAISLPQELKKYHLVQVV